MKRKPIQVSERIWRIILLEAFRQSLKATHAVTMGQVIAGFAEKINRKHKHIK